MHPYPQRASGLTDLAFQIKDQRSKIKNPSGASMSEPKVLTCPTCGAQLHVTGEEPQVKCDYCGNNVIVPEELRVKKAEPIRIEMPQPQVVFVQPTPVAAQTVVTSATSSGLSLF